MNEFHAPGLTETKQGPEMDSPTHQTSALLPVGEGSSHWDIFWKTSKITDLVFVLHFWNVKKTHLKTPVQRKYPHSSAVFINTRNALDHLKFMKLEVYFVSEIF